MLSAYAGVIEWGFQIGLFCILVATLIYARRLESTLRQVRADQGGLSAMLSQIDAAISAASAAADRLMADSSRVDASLREACDTAEIMTRKLDDLLGRSSLMMKAQVAPVSPALSGDEPLRTRPDHLSASKPAMRSLTPRRAAKPHSRAERDLARMLSDAS